LPDYGVTKKIITHQSALFISNIFPRGTPLKIGGVSESKRKDVEVWGKWKLGERRENGWMCGTKYLQFACALQWLAGFFTICIDSSIHGLNEAKKLHTI
jgi:hypothetical protein